MDTVTVFVTAPVCICIAYLALVMFHFCKRKNLNEKLDLSKKQHKDVEVLIDEL